MLYHSFNSSDKNIFFKIIERFMRNVIFVTFLLKDLIYLYDIIK